MIGKTSNVNAIVPAGQSIWKVVKKNDCFLVKEFENEHSYLRFNKESNDIYDVNSYKHSDLPIKHMIKMHTLI